MVALPEVKTLDEAIIKSNNNFLVPDGWHKVVLIKSGMEDGFLQGSPQDLVFHGVITHGEAKDSEFEIRCGILNHTPIKADNPSFTWSTAGYSTLGHISKALGDGSTPQTSEQLHNRPLMIRTETKEGNLYTDKSGEQRKGWDKSIIKEYKALPEGSATAQPAPMAAPTPAQQAPSAEAHQPTAQQNPFAAPTAENDEIPF